MSNDPGTAMQDVYVTFDDINRAEEKRQSFNAELQAIHYAAIAEWDRLFGALMGLQKKHRGSDAMWDSKMGALFAAYKASQEVIAEEGMNEVPDIS